MARARTFLAVDLDPAVRQAATALQASLAKSVPGVKWADPATFHITLQFLGEVDDRELHAVCRVADAVARRLPPFALGLGGVGAFPNPRRPKVVWAGVTAGAGELQRLFTELEDGLLEAGAYRRENRAYTPHLTLGRLADDAGGADLAGVLPKFQTWAGGQTAVGEVVVFTSQLRRDGPEYTPVGRAALRGRPEAALRPPADATE